jgi:hypothetical protein
MSAIVTLLSLACLLRTAAAGPAQTPAARDNDSLDTGFSPRPTPAPGVLLHDLLLLPRDPLAAVAAAPLVKRDFESWLCGYESGIKCTSFSSPLSMSIFNRSRTAHRGLARIADDYFFLPRTHSQQSHVRQLGIVRLLHVASRRRLLRLLREHGHLRLPLIVHRLHRQLRARVSLKHTASKMVPTNFL